MSMKEPIWNIMQNGSSQPVDWVDHKPNSRFAIYNPGNSTNPSDDLVFDKETGLIWPRDANKIGQYNWLDANTLCRHFELGNRSGWRLPTVEELSSLIDPGQSNLALPAGHPFGNIQYGSGVNPYWTSTNYENPSGAAWFVNFWRGAGPQLVDEANKSTLGHVWPVRSGSVGNNWNW
jgi:hypothetical protein